ncbi:hypothetical protein SJAV_07750 [Sulfurisphaera javensis]|uniref:Uncharacterized protein n=1 Tax=Sulfurisphaera javensis TaxID=2049879 RepID=A0AAT9GQB8_9CREN
MGYTIKDLLDENGNIRKLPKGFSTIEIKGPNRVLIFNDKFSILLVRVYKNIFASRISTRKTVLYKFLKTDDEIITEEGKINVGREDYLRKALDKVIKEIEENFETEKAKDVLFYLYLIRGCIKGDKSSCNELQDLVYFETVK